MTIKWNFGLAAERARFNLKGKTFNLKLKKKNKKKREATSPKPQAPSALKGTQLKGIIKNRVAQVLHSRNKLENHN